MAEEQKVYYVVVQRPLLHEELDRLVQEVADDEDQEGTAEEIVKANTMRIAVVSATRSQAYRRIEAQTAARRWFVQKLGLDSFDQITEISIEALDRDLYFDWMTIWNACDITGALVPDLCENWEPPEEIGDWAEVKDYIFQPLLRRVWELNPQWLNDWMEQTGALEEAARGNR